MPSFDTVLEPNLVEVRNAVDQAAKEIGTRFDFKGPSAKVELKDKDITLYGDRGDDRHGVTVVIFYDPVERVIATLHPNHTYEKVVFDPWRQLSCDVNDTVAPRNDQTGNPRTDPYIHGYVEKYFRTQPADWKSWRQQRIGGAMGQQERTAAEKAGVHADTPTTAHFEALGRPFLTIAQNRFERDGVVTEEEYATRVVLDIEGNQREVIDAKDRIVMRYHYDMLGNRIRQASMEAGERWSLNNVAGKPIRAWDSRRHMFTTAYDALQRPTHQYAA